MKSLSSLVNFVKRLRMKWFKSWYFGVIIVWLIILLFTWIKGDFVEVKTPWEFIIYVSSTILAIAGTTLTIIGISQGIRKIAVILTNKTRIVSRFVEALGKWFFYAEKNRELPTGFYYLLLGLALLIVGYLLMSYLFNSLRFFS